MHVNLLPRSFVLRRLVQQRLRQWACAFGAVGVVLVLLSLPLLNRWVAARQNLQLLQNAAEPIRELQGQQIELAKQSVAIEKKLGQLKKTVTIDRSTVLLGIVTQAVKAAEQQVQVQEMQVTVNEGQHRLTLRGLASASEPITLFMESLQASNVFPRVELRSTQERFVSDRTVQEFQLECLANE
jgi:type II secretory pathway component PulL